MEMSFRAFAASDTVAVLRLNAESVAVLSPMAADRFQLLNHMTCLHLVAEDAGGVVGFLMAFNDGVPYDSVNYQWFATRFKRFVYIDRVAVSAACRGAGVGRQFYERAEAYAATAGMAWLVCEVDVEPPNPGSLAFHARLGFVEVGRHVGTGGKVVSLQARSIDAQRRSLLSSK